MCKRCAPTLTIDDDLAGLLRRRARELGISLKDMANRTIRAGLDQDARPQRKSAPKTIPHSFGIRPGIDPDKLNRLADELEVEACAASARKPDDPAGRQRPDPRP